MTSIEALKASMPEGTDHPFIFYRDCPDGTRHFMVGRNQTFFPAGYSMKEALAKQHIFDAHACGSLDPRVGVYFIQGIDGGPIKIGSTSHGAARRIAQFQVGSPVKLSLIAWIQGGTKPLEKAIHHYLKPHRLHGEWFKPSHQLHELMWLNSHISSCP